MYDAQPETLNVGKLLRVEACPASDGPGSKLPDLQLRRWRDIFSACVGWHQGTEPAQLVADLFGWVDPVQRDLCAGLLARYVSLMGSYRDRVVDFEPTGVSVRHPSESVFLSAAVALELEGLEGRELLKLRTGRRGSTAEETAVLLSGADVGESVVEVVLGSGEVGQLTMDQARREELVARLFGLWEQQKDALGGGRRAGMHCYWCPRPARCGQYPTPDGSTVGSRQRTVLLPKTGIKALEFCERQVAWKRLYGIPDDEGDEDEGDYRAVGNTFHELIAPALLADDSAEAFEGSLLTLDPSEVATMRHLFARHQQLEAAHEHPIHYRAVEYQIGVTLTVPGLDVDSRGTLQERKPVAVVLMARADATGRESDGMPAVTEHRTGPGSTQVDQLELDLYAVGAALRSGQRRAAVHLHQLGLPDGPVCVREVYDPDRLDQALERLVPAAVMAAGWHPADATGPGYTVGEWCQWCGYRRRCENYRRP